MLQLKEKVAPLYSSISNYLVDKKWPCKVLSFLNNYYFYIIGAYYGFNFIGSLFNGTASSYVFLIAFVFFTAKTDVRKDVKWLPYLALMIPFIMIIKYVNAHGYEFWGKMLSWQIAQGIVIDLNPLFSKIPLNDAAFMRIIHSETLTWFLRIVYNNGFVLPVLICIMRSAVIKDFKKAVRYALSAHIFQVFLITPFYLMFHLQEVWYVLGHPDGMNRNFTPEQAAGWTLNCFPSMHTSIAFAMFLLVLREKDKVFKWVWGFFCLSVIYSTMYLEIHWVIDVLGGLLLAYGTVKLADFVIAKFDLLILKYKRIFYYKNTDDEFVTTSI